MATVKSFESVSPSIVGANGEGLMLEMSALESLYDGQFT